MWEDPTIFRADLMAGRRALITGGGTGIGLAIAAELRLLGADVFLASRKESNLEAGAEALQAIEAPGAVGWRSCDIRDEEAIEATVEAALEAMGGVDFLVNNAGGQFPTPALAMRAKGWRAVIETNLTGTFLMSQATASKAFAPQGHGAIVNIIAQMWNGFPMMSHTGAARAGVDNLTKSLAFELAPLKVRVNAVAPGVILSSGIESYAPEFRKAFEGAVRYIPAGRLGSPREVAAAVVFLLSPAAHFITGTTLRVDGGEPLMGSASACQLNESLQHAADDPYR